MPRPLAGLPSFQWDEKAARYRVVTGGYGQRAGSFVAREKVLNLVTAKIDEGQKRLPALTREFQTGNLSAKQWQVAFAEQLKTLYVQEAALGAGGYDKLTRRDFGRIGGYLRAEYQRLPGFAQDVLDEKATELQAAARSRMYAGKARGVFVEAEREVNRDAGHTEERRILGAAEHCKVCPDWAARGWLPLGTNPTPGTHEECYGNCLCILDYR